MFKFHNGDYVEDLVTGLRGVVTARSDHLSGCNRYSVQPAVDKEGKFVEGFWVDEPMLRLDPAKPRLVIEHVQAGEPPG